MKLNKTILITEDISQPIDEGIKKFSYRLALYILSENEQNKVFSIFTNPNIKNLEQLPANKFFFSLSFFWKLLSYKPHDLIYIPGSSSTLMSFIRLTIMSLFSGKAKKIMISVQERKYGSFSKKLIKFMKPTQMIVLSRKEMEYYYAMGINTTLSPIGVDIEKFTAITVSEKQTLRNKLGLPEN